MTFFQPLRVFSNFLCDFFSGLFVNHEYNSIYLWISHIPVVDFQCHSNMTREHTKYDFSPFQFIDAWFAIFYLFVCLVFFFAALGLEFRDLRLLGRYHLSHSISPDAVLRPRISSFLHNIQCTFEKNAFFSGFG
jgi:hypothetical protein